MTMPRLGDVPLLPTYIPERSFTDEASEGVMSFVKALKMEKARALEEALKRAQETRAEEELGLRRRESDRQDQEFDIRSTEAAQMMEQRGRAMDKLSRRQEEIPRTAGSLRSRFGKDYPEIAGMADEDVLDLFGPAITPATEAQRLAAETQRAGRTTLSATGVEAERARIRAAFEQQLNRRQTERRAQLGKDDPFALRMQGSTPLPLSRADSTVAMGRTQSLYPSSPGLTSELANSLGLSLGENPEEVITADNAADAYDALLGNNVSPQRAQELVCAKFPTEAACGGR